MKTTLSKEKLLKHYCGNSLVLWLPLNNLDPNLGDINNLKWDLEKPGDSLEGQLVLIN